MVEHCRIEMRHGVCIDVSNARLGYPIPIFQRGFKVSLEKIHGSQKIIAIGIMWVEPQGAPQITRRLGIVLLFELDSSQFQRKSFVMRLKAGAGLEGIVSFLPTAELCQRCAVIEIQISGTRIQGLQSVDCLLPALFCEQLLDALDKLRARRGSLGSKVKRKEQKDD